VRGGVRYCTEYFVRIGGRYCRRGGLMEDYLGMDGMGWDGTSDGDGLQWLECL
jgi:hypothetical protein